MSAVDACRRLAGALWRRERHLDDLQLGGLNSSYAVRDRLRALRRELLRRGRLPERARARLSRIDFSRGTPFSILTGTEAILEMLTPESEAEGVQLLRAPRAEVACAARMVVVQCLAARLGWWIPRGEEVEDAQLAQGRYRAIHKPAWGAYRDLVQAAHARYERGHHLLAAQAVFHADRLVRSPRELLLGVEALRALGAIDAALWTCRVCLLEPLASFSSQAQYLRVEALEARLKDQCALQRPPMLDADEMAILAEAFSDVGHPWEEGAVEPEAPVGVRLENGASRALTQARTPRLISQTFDLDFWGMTEAQFWQNRPGAGLRSEIVPIQDVRAAPVDRARAERMEPPMSAQTLEILLDFSKWKAIEAREERTGLIEQLDLDQLPTRSALRIRARRRRASGLPAAGQRGRRKSASARDSTAHGSLAGRR